MGQPGYWRRPILLVPLLLAVVIGLFVIIGLTGTSGSRGPDKLDAANICQQFVSDRLRAPSTANFQNIGQATVTPLTDGVTFTVSSYVDAQNGFGAQIRTRYTCSVTNTGGDNWRLLSLDM